MRHILFVTAALFAFQAMPVLADHHEKEEMKSTEEKPLKGDVDGDGTISEAEYLEQAKARFKKIDLNGDGKLHRQEMFDFHKQKKYDNEVKKAKRKQQEEMIEMKKEQAKKDMERLGTKIK